MKIFKIIYICFISSLLINCSNFKNAMTGQGKQKTTDEFLVKKKDPLILPPEFDKLPLPNSKKEITQESSIQSILGSSSKVNKNPKDLSNLENMILKELRKNN
tara:strand:+ start:250 stop:558 length:309 start_codon:yes stop_codon:yes gene_type:complete